MVTKWMFGKKLIKSIEDCPSDSEGFVYRITSLLDDRYYLGSKKLYNNKTIKLSKKKQEELYSGRGRKKTKEKKKTVSDFMTYKSSSNELQELILLNGEVNFKFEIIKFFNNYTDMILFESYLIIKDFLDKNKNIINKWVTLKIRKND